MIHNVLILLNNQISCKIDIKLDGDKELLNIIEKAKHNCDIFYVIARILGKVENVMRFPISEISGLMDTDFGF